MRVYLGVSTWGIVAIDGMDGTIYQSIPFKTHSWFELVQKLHRLKIKYVPFWNALNNVCNTLKRVVKYTDCGFITLVSYVYT